MLRGEDPQGIANAIGVSAATLAQWQAVFLQGGRRALSEASAHASFTTVFLHDAATPPGCPFEDPRQQCALVRAANDALFAMLQSIPIPVQAFDRDGLTIFLNTAQMRFLGISDPMISVGQFNVLQDPFTEQAGVLHLYKKAYTGEPVAVPETRITFHPDDGWDTTPRTAYYEQLLLPVVRGGAVEMVLSFVIDTTDRYLARNVQAEALRREGLALLAGGVAHDLNNVLTIVQLAASLFRERPVPVDDLEDAAADIEDAVAVARALSQQLKMYAQAEHEAQTRLNLKTIISNMHTLLRAALTPGVALQVEISPDTPDILGVTAHLQQVLLNLVVNADQAIEATGQITIRLYRRVLQAPIQALGAEDGILAAGTYACLEVADTGCGMSSLVSQRAFDPYYTTRTDGNGMGLATVIGVVQSHRGGVVLRTEVGAGTSFGLFFPAASTG
ncbi:MAG: ATP-binding protein [Myxococcota bacterium]